MKKIQQGPWHRMLCVEVTLRKTLEEMTRRQLWEDLERWQQGITGQEQKVEAVGMDPVHLLLHIF
jgi:hypothetical protein